MVGDVRFGLLVDGKLRSFMTVAQHTTDLHGLVYHNDLADVPLSSYNGGVVPVDGPHMRWLCCAGTFSDAAI